MIPIFADKWNTIQPFVLAYHAYWRDLLGASCTLNRWFLIDRLLVWVIDGFIEIRFCKTSTNWRKNPLNKQNANTKSINMFRLIAWKRNNKFLTKITKLKLHSDSFSFFFHSFFSISMFYIILLGNINYASIICLFARRFSYGNPKGKKTITTGKSKQNQFNAILENSVSIEFHSLFDLYKFNFL